jgi:2,5-furandicarboxylate decarboxylase 1
MEKQISTCSLRSFLDIVKRERPREFLEIHRAVSPQYETAAILTKLEQSFRYPTVRFNNIVGTSLPVVSNVAGSMARIALALNCSVRELPQHYAEACANPLAPALTSDAPVQENVKTGEKVNLGWLPQMAYHENDAHHPYITAAIVVARDPETGRSNLSFHRLMILDRRTTTIFIAKGKHLSRIFEKYQQANEPMPIAAFIGVHPAVSLGALYTGSSDVQEYEIIGSLQQCPLQLAKCVTNDLRIPAAAEIVLEGTVDPRKSVSEGPFGEFTGYSTGETTCPIFDVAAVTSRREPIFQDIVSGGSEHHLLPLLGMEHNLLQHAQAVAPGVLSVRMLIPLTVFAALCKQDDSDPRRIICALFESDIYVKQVVVVDEDVDISDIRQVATAIALHVRADRDIHIQKDGRGTELDPACEHNNGRIVKFGIDATVPLSGAKRVMKNRVPEHVLDSINLADLLRGS